MSSDALCARTIYYKELLRWPLPRIKSGVASAAALGDSRAGSRVGVPNPTMKFFEDIRVGETSDIGRHTFTAEEIKSFAARFDPQPFHLDEAAAERSHFGRLSASGWHTACVWMWLLVEHRRREDDARRARGEPVATLGVSPGFRDLEWRMPVYVGDTIAYANEVIDKRPSLSRRQWGILTARNSGTNQHGQLVLSFISSAFVERRPRREQAS